MASNDDPQGLSVTSGNGVLISEQTRRRTLLSGVVSCVPLVPPTQARQGGEGSEGEIH